MCLQVDVMKSHCTHLQVGCGCGCGGMSVYTFIYRWMYWSLSIHVHIYRCAYTCGGFKGVLIYVYGLM